jgi:chemotaxis signal transduction protein
MIPSSVVRHMSSVEDYRQRLATLQGAWDTLSLLSHLNGDGTDMGSTRQAFEALAADLVKSLATETHNKALLALKSKSQIAIDVLVRNLFERTADIGFLSTDSEIRDYARAHAQPGTDGDDGLKRAQDRLQRRFREYVAKYSVYDDVVLLAPDGRVLARLDHRYSNLRCVDPLLQTTLASRAPYVETFGPSTLFPNDARKLIYSYRVSEGSRVLGVLCLCFKFDDEVAGIFAKLRETSDWSVFGFLDQHGKVLASTDPWQMPLDAPIPLALDEGGSVIRFAGREYLAITRRTRGYQGYQGPGWYGHAMIPLEHAFERNSSSSKIPEQMLADLRESQAIFSDELRRIPTKADAIQRELNRAVWNGNVRLSQRSGTNNNFAKVLLWEIGNAGRRTQNTFERSTSDLQETVVSSILEASQQLAALAVDVLDRNLYERANDCRWWSLTADLMAHLAHGEHKQQIAATLRHINSLYTVYHDIVLFDAERRIRAVSNPDHAARVGQVIDEPWAATTLALRNSQDFSVSEFTPSKLYRNERTLVFGAAIRNESGRTVGGIGIVFDCKAQFIAMLQDALPRTQSGECAPGCIGLFVDTEMRVIATTGDHALGEKIDLPRELLLDAQEGRLISLNGTHYAAGARKTAGYREYSGLGATAIILIPLGPVSTAHDASRKVTKHALNRETTSNEQALDIATFRSGEQWLGLLRDQVVEAVDGGSLRAVPGAPAWYVGLLMYRGAPLPVVDLARFAGTESKTHGRDVIIARASQDSPAIGLLVDDLDDIPEIAASRILPVTDFAQRGRPSIVDRAVRPNQPDDPVLFIVNLDQVLLHTRALAPTASASTAVKAR